MDCIDAVTGGGDGELVMRHDRNKGHWKWKARRQDTVENLQDVVVMKDLEECYPKRGREVHDPGTNQVEDTLVWKKSKIEGQNIDTLACKVGATSLD